MSELRKCPLCKKNYNPKPKAGRGRKRTCCPDCRPRRRAIWVSNYLRNAAKKKRKR